MSGIALAGAETSGIWVIFRLQQSGFLGVYLRLWMQKSAGNKPQRIHFATDSTGPSSGESYAGGTSARPAHRQIANQGLHRVAGLHGLHLDPQGGEFYSHPLPI